MGSLDHVIFPHSSSDHDPHVRIHMEFEQWGTVPRLVPRVIKAIQAYTLTSLYIREPMDDTSFPWSDLCELIARLRILHVTAMGYTKLIGVLSPKHEQGCLLPALCELRL